MSPAGDSRLRCISTYIILQSVLREISLALAMTVVAANRYYCYYYYCNHHRRRYWNSSQPLSGGAINTAETVAEAGNSIEDKISSARPYFRSPMDDAHTRPRPQGVCRDR